MKIFNDVYITRDAAYKSCGSIILGTQRISLDQPQEYWQNANLEMTLSKHLKETDIVQEPLLYVGRIPRHFGHFLLEGLPRMAELINLNMPFIGYATNGFLPPGIESMKIEEIYKVISLISEQKFYEIAENEVYNSKTLIVPDLPITLSHTTNDPEKMSKLIKKIVLKCRELHPYINDIDTLRLNRLDEKCDDNSNNPNDSITLQIAKVSMAKNLLGKSGSNTHLSMFANKFTKLSWEHRNDPDQTDRNQLICDLIKTYNEF